MPPIPWSTKIGVGHNCCNNIDLHKLSGVAPLILGQ
jgi:hypothetical protein